MNEPMASIPSATPSADSLPEKPVANRLGLLRWLVVVVFLLGAYAAVSQLPELFAPAQAPVPGTPPSAAMLLAVGLAVTVLSAGIVYLALGTSRSFPKLVIALFMAYNALIVLVKFVLGPQSVWRDSYIASFYRGEAPTPAQVQAAAGSSATGTAIWNGIGLFLLYAGAFTLLFLSYRLRTRLLLERLGRATRMRRFLALPLAAVFIFAGSLIFVGVFVVPMMTNDPYIRDVLSSGTGLLAAAMLAAAIAAATGAFQLAGARAVLIRDAGTLTALFWLGLAMLAVYHVLWVVYILTLLAMWPVKATILYHGK